MVDKLQATVRIERVMLVLEDEGPTARVTLAPPGTVERARA